MADTLILAQRDLFWISDLQGCQIIHFCWLKPLSSWRFVPVAKENEYTLPRDAHTDPSSHWPERVVKSSVWKCGPAVIVLRIFSRGVGNLVSFMKRPFIFQ